MAKDTTNQTRTQASQPRRSRDVQGTTATPERKELPSEGIAVRATQRGFYGGNPIAVGQEFAITDKAHFSEKWMEKIAGGKAKPAAAPAGNSSSATGDGAPDADDPLGAGQ